MTFFGLLERVVMAYERDVDARIKTAQMYLEQGERNRIAGAEAAEANRKAGKR